MKKFKKPYFKLRNIKTDGLKDEPLLHTLNAVNGTCSMDRRGFLTTGTLAFASLMASCGGGGGGGSGDIENNNPVPLEEDENCTFHTRVGAHLYVKGLVFSPDGKYLASSSGKDPRVKFWNIPSNELLHYFKFIGGTVGKIDFSPDTKKLAILGSSRIDIIEMPDGIEKNVIDLHSFQITFESFKFSLDCEYLITGASDGEIRIFEVSTGNLIYQFSTGHISLNTLALSPDGTILATGGVGSNNPDINLWKVLSGKLLQTLEAPSGWISDTLFSKDGKFLISRVNDYGLDTNFVKVKIWEISSGNLITELKSEYLFMAINPDGRLLLVTGDGVVEILEIPSGTLFDTFVLNSFECKNFKTLSLTHDGRLLAGGFYSTYFDATIKLWDMSSGEFLTSLFDPEATNYNVELSYYSLQDSFGNSIMYTAPCNSTLPATATCTCNCVEGSYKHTGGGGGGGGICSCVPVCYCVPVWF